MAGPTRNRITAIPSRKTALVAKGGKASVSMNQFIVAVKGVLAPGVSTTIATPGGGSVTVVNGIVTGQTASGAGFSGTVALAPTTSGGSAGSLTVADGIITAYTAPT
jgi:hypothetical protein